MFGELFHSCMIHCHVPELTRAQKRPCGDERRAQSHRQPQVFAGVQAIGAIFCNSNTENGAGSLHSDIATAPTSYRRAIAVDRSFFTIGIGQEPITRSLHLPYKPSESTLSDEKLFIETVSGKICHVLMRNNQSTNQCAAQSCSFTFTSSETVF